MCYRFRKVIKRIGTFNKYKKKVRCKDWIFGQEFFTLKEKRTEVFGARNQFLEQLIGKVMLLRRVRTW